VIVSLILRAGTQVLLPLFLLYSVFLLLRGHDEPGGGFTGGLVAATGFVLHAFAHGFPAARRLLRADPGVLIGCGLALALASGLPSLVAGQAYLTSRWTTVKVGRLWELHVGTPLLFDLGVYLVVVGVALKIALTLGEVDDEGEEA
jgi:multicomponent Na+:H+ antiporter subunit B